jgi:hypothetical protein
MEVMEPCVSHKQEKRHDCKKQSGTHRGPNALERRATHEVVGFGQGISKERVMLDVVALHVHEGIMDSSPEHCHAIRPGPRKKIHRGLII